MVIVEFQRILPAVSNKRPDFERGYFPSFHGLDGPWALHVVNLVPTTACGRQRGANSNLATLLGYLLLGKDKQTRDLWGLDDDEICRI